MRCWADHIGAQIQMGWEERGASCSRDRDPNRRNPLRDRVDSTDNLWRQSPNAIPVNINRQPDHR